MPTAKIIVDEQNFILSKDAKSYSPFIIDDEIYDHVYQMIENAI